MVMFCDIGPYDFVADTAAFDPPMMLTALSFSFLSRHLDIFVRTFFFLQVSVFSALSVYFRYLIRHILGHSCPSDPAVIAGMEANCPTINPEETSDPENFPTAVFIPLSRLLDLRGI